MIYSRSLCKASSLKAPMTVYLGPFHLLVHIIVIYYNEMSKGLRSEWACCIISWGRLHLAEEDILSECFFLAEDTVYFGGGYTLGMEWRCLVVSTYVIMSTL